LRAPIASLPNTADDGQTGKEIGLKRCNTRAAEAGCVNVNHPGDSNDAPGAKVHRASGVLMGLGGRVALFEGVGIRTAAYLPINPASSCRADRDAERAESGDVENPAWNVTAETRCRERVRCVPIDRIERIGATKNALAG